MPSIYEQSAEFRKALLARDKASAARLTEAYMRAWNAIKKQLDLLNLRIKSAEEAGETINQAWLYRQDRYLALLRQVGVQLGHFAEIAGKEITREQRKAIAAAESDARALMMAGAEQAGIEASFNRVPEEAFRNIVGFLGNGSPLKTLLDELPRNAGLFVADELTSGVAAGRGPNEIARRIAKYLEYDPKDPNNPAVPLDRAKLIARTETLRAYREASRETYRSNSDLVDGWIWVSSKSSRTCAACLALDGTWHPLTEPQGAHPACRCTQIPSLRGEDLPKQTTGEKWFAEQPAKVKEEILGSRAAYEAVRDKKLKLRDFVGRKDSIQWGTSYYALGLGRALNNEGRFPANERPPDLLSFLQQ